MREGAGGLAISGPGGVPAVKDCETFAAGI